MDILKPQAAVEESVYINPRTLEHDVDDATNGVTVERDGKKWLRVDLRVIAWTMRWFDRATAEFRSGERDIKTMKTLCENMDETIRRVMALGLYSPQEVMWAMEQTEIDPVRNFRPPLS